MGEEFPVVLRAYTEIGILGLLSVLVVVLIWRSYGRKGKDDNWKKDKLDKKDEILESDRQSVSKQLQDITKMLMEASARNLEQEKEMNKELIKQIIEGVTTHSMSQTENDKLTSVNRQIDMILKDMLDDSNASRAFLVQYHNGGRGANKQAFLKMSMTNEKTAYHVKSVISQCRDQFRSSLGYFVNEIGEKGYCSIFDVEEMKEKDCGIYDIMTTRGIEVKCGCGIHNRDGMVIGFLCLEFENKDNADRLKVQDAFKEHYREIERLLNS